MRLVKPVSPPIVDEVPIDESTTVTPTENPVQTFVEDESFVFWENDQTFVPLLPGTTEEILEESDIQAPAEEEVQESPIAQLSTEEMAQSIAEMVAAQEVEENEKRIRRLSGEGVSSIAETFYLRSWLRKVRRVGQLNYPSEAVEQKLYGKLSLYVSIAPDGALVETRVLESSGHEVLDKAAVNIVKLAAPFAPFPVSIANDTDLLEIVREWEFRKDEYTTDPPEQE